MTEHEEARRFLEEFLAGEFEELELSIEQYGYLARLVPHTVWLPKDEKHFVLVTERGRLLYRKEIGEDSDVKLTLEKEDDDGKS